MEHQLRYETARANLYEKAFKSLLSGIRYLTSDAEASTKAERKLLDHDWRKVEEAGLVETNRKCDCTFCDYANIVKENTELRECISEWLGWWDREEKSVPPHDVEEPQKYIDAMRKAIKKSEVDND